jgi:DNA-binding LytR/AlgR family response regulator
MIRAIALDDEPLALELIQTYCNKLDFVQFEKGFSNTNQAWQYLEQEPVDLLFLDINMPAISGLDFYQSLSKKPLLIFSTSYSEYALDSYDLGAVDYLLKPFSFQRFEKAVKKAYEIFQLLKTAKQKEEDNYLMLKLDYGLVKILLTDIVFIEGLDNYIKIHLQNQHPLVVRMTMKLLQEKLPPTAFIRVHRSYIVPFSKIESVKNRIINIAGEEIPIGKSYETELQLMLNK